MISSQNIFIIDIHSDPFMHRFCKPGSMYKIYHPGMETSAKKLTIKNIIAGKKHIKILY